MIRILSLCLIITSWTGNSQPADHSPWTEILQTYVSDKGEVNYKELRNNKSVLENYQSVKNTVEEEGKLLVYLNNEISAKELNSYAFEHKIILEHLVKRKNSLEEQFLELTKNK